jgi:hypothetical protein
MEDLGAQYLCVSCKKITKIKYLSVDYSVSIFDMNQYRRQVERFKQVDSDPDLDPKHYYEYTIGMCPECYETAQKNHSPDIEKSVNQLTFMLNQKASELSIEISDILYSRIETELSNLSLESIHIAIGEDFNYLYANSSVFASKPFSADKNDRQTQILKKHISAIERYLIQKASGDPMFTLMMDIYKETYMQDRQELLSVLETDANNFYAIQMKSEDGLQHDTQRTNYKKIQIRFGNELENIPPERLFYTYDETIFKLPYPMRFDRILTTVRLENGKAFKKVLEVVQEHDKN